MLVFLYQFAFSRGDLFSEQKRNGARLGSGGSPVARCAPLCVKTETALPHLTARAHSAPFYVRRRRSPSALSFAPASRRSQVAGFARCAPLCFRTESALPRLTARAESALFYVRRRARGRALAGWHLKLSNRVLLFRFAVPVFCGIDRTNTFAAAVYFPN